MMRARWISWAMWTVLTLAACSGNPDDTPEPVPNPAAPLPNPPTTPTPPSSPAPPPPAAPTGQTVIYETFVSATESNLYAIDEDGTNPRTLASTAQREHFRGVSLDGWVIYDCDVSGGGSELVSVRIADGAERVLDSSSSGKLFRGVTADNRVVYQMSSPTSGGINSVRPDGSAPVVLVDEPSANAEFIDAMPDGRVLYQLCRRVTGDVPRCDADGLYSVAADGTDRRLLAAGMPRVALTTADGRVLYEVGGDIFSVPAAGGAAVALASSPDHEWNPRLLPDGRVLYARQVANQWDVYLVNADGSGTRPLLTSSDHEFVSGITLAGRIIYARRDTAGRDNLYAIDADGTGLAVLGDSTDGESVRYVTAERVVYSTRRTAGMVQDDLYSVRLDGTDLRILADSQEFEWFEDLAPDGRAVYMRCIAAPGGPCGDPTAQSDLYSVPLNGVGTTGLATTGEFEVFRAVTANNRVIYERINNGQHDIGSVKTDGTEARALTSNTADERYQRLY